MNLILIWHVFLFMSWENSICSVLNFNKRYFTLNKLEYNFNNDYSSNKKTPYKISRLDNKCKYVLGKAGPNKHSHVLAFEQLNSAKVITASKINEILVFCDVKISDEELKYLVNIPSFKLNNLDRKMVTKQIIKNKLGTAHGKQRSTGVYIFTHLTTGKKYVGSSTELALRLNGYINFTHRKTGLLIPLLIKEKLCNFSLEIFPLSENYRKGWEIALEQYYLLDSSYNLNTIKVANNPGGSNAKSLYMYNRDMSILYYSSLQQIDFIRKFNIHHTTFTKHLNNATYYLGKYLFSREPVLTAKIKDLNDLDLFLMLKKDRLKFNRSKPLTSSAKSVVLKEVNDKNNIIMLASLAKCLEYLKNKGISANQKTLIKYINAGKSYQGYICKFV